MTRQRSPELADYTTVSIRFPDDVYKWLKSKSDSERRSFNAQVLLELEKRMQDEADSAHAN